MVETLITIVHVIVATFMILVVLVQGGNSGGVGAAFGGGNSQGVLGATGGQSLLGKITYGAALIFMVTTLSLTIIQGGSGEVGLKEQLKQNLPATTAPTDGAKAEDDTKTDK
jgi:preprotein translocase subunit SecG